MILSMTGYGKAERRFGARNITVELRSLNSKAMDLNVKIPNAYRYFEYDIRTIVAKAMQRGKIDLYISLTAESDAEISAINREAFAAYHRQIAGICRDNGFSPNSRHMAANIVGAILRMPDVVRSHAEEVGDEELALLNACITEAIEKITEFRRREGEALIADILSRVGMIEKLNEEVTPFAGARVETIRRKVEEGIEKIGIAVDHIRLAQELIYYTERLDITEEKVRLTNHCAYFRQVAADEDASGRKLGFICQEMGREINTMGAKASHAEIQQIVVRMKDELEKIKEQLLNIL